MNNVLISNLTNFVSIIHCAGACDITVKNSVWENNEGQCYNGEAVRNGIFLVDDAGATVQFINTTLYGSPWKKYDSTSTITFDTDSQILNTSDAWYNDETCRFYGLPLYWAHNETVVAGNNCTDEAVPCTEWTEIASIIENGDILYLQEDRHDLPSQFDMLEIKNVWEDQNYTFIGNLLIASRQPSKIGPGA